MLTLLFSSCSGASSGDPAGGDPSRSRVPVGLVDGPRIADHTVINAVRQGRLPVDAIEDAKDILRIGYGHTSHGSQLADGMSGLVGFANGTGCAGAYSGHQNLFAWNAHGTNGALDLREGSGYGTGFLSLDCGYNRDASHDGWDTETRDYLNSAAGADVNVIIWSWCGQAASRTESSMLSTYLNLMDDLENDYPNVTFVYMTGHLNGTGTGGNLHLRNEQIRAWCRDHDKWLFDFADIESYDPDGTVNYNELLASDGCVYDYDDDGICERENETQPVDGDRNWAADWQASHTQGTDWYSCGSAHSMALNANMKAYAAWWLWARLGGWDGTLN